MRFSREVMQKSAGSGLSGPGAAPTRSSHFATFLCTYLISTNLSIYLFPLLAVAALIKAPDDGSSRVAQAVFAGPQLRPQKCGCRPDGSGRQFARQLGGREGVPMRFSREVMQKSASSVLSAPDATQISSSRFAKFPGTYLISTTLLTLYPSPF